MVHLPHFGIESTNRTISNKFIWPDHFKQTTEAVASASDPVLVPDELINFAQPEKNNDKVWVVSLGERKKSEAKLKFLCDEAKNMHSKTRLY